MKCASLLADSPRVYCYDWNWDAGTKGKETSNSLPDGEMRTEKAHKMSLLVRCRVVGREGNSEEWTALTHRIPLPIYPGEEVPTQTHRQCSLKSDWPRLKLPRRAAGRLPVDPLTAFSVPFPTYEACYWLHVYPKWDSRPGGPESIVQGPDRTSSNL